MGYDGQDRRSFNERIAADKEASLARQAASDNWLSDVLVTIEQEGENTAERSASIAFRKRAHRRYASYVRKAVSEADFEARVAVIEDGLRDTATEVAREYEAENAEDMFTQARTAAGDFFYDSNPWGPGGAVADQAQQQTEVCPHCKMTKPVGGACPNCGFNAPASAGTGAELGGLQQRMNSLKTAGKECPQCGTEAGESKDSEGNVTCNACGYEKFNEALAKENEAKKSTKVAHPNCKGEGCKFCENKGKMGPGQHATQDTGKTQDEIDAEDDADELENLKNSKSEHDFGFDADEGDDSAEGKKYRKDNKGKEQGSKDDDEDDDAKESSYHEKLAMAVSKKDFNAIAAILQQNGADPQLAQQIADYFATQNENFDNDRFMDASGAGGQQDFPTPNAGPQLPPDATFSSTRTAGIHAASEDMWHADSIHEAAGAELRGDKYQYERVSPDEEIGPGAIADGPSYPTDTVEDVLKGSKDHPSERREVLDFDAAENTDPKIERKVDEQDLGADNPYKEQTGSGQGGTFGDSHGVTEPTSDTSDAKLGSTFRWHVL